MSEIEKMYENIGVKADRIVCYRGFDNCMDNDFNCHCHNEKPCKDAAKIYPPFTAEKQIELIKWLGKSKNGFGFFNDNTEGLSCHCDFHWEWFDKDFYAEDFDNALAGLINKLWQSLTEEEKQQVKGILE